MRILNNKGFNYLVLQISLFFISNIGLFLSQFSIKNNGQKNQLLAFFAGVLFWGGLILAVVFTILINKTANQKNSNNKSGIITFFSNKTAAIFDVTMIISSIIFVTILIVNSMSNVVIVVFSIFIFSFEMHCVFNGKNYKYIISKLGEKKDGKI